MQVSVLAQDKHGQPITDLRREDFRVFDEGQEQKLEFFSSTAGLASQAAPSQLPPGTWTNTHATAVPDNLLLILLDGLNTPIRDVPYAKKNLTAFLSQLRPEDHVALYSLGDSLKLVQDFTRNSASLLRGLSRIEGYRGPQTISMDEQGEQDTGVDAIDGFAHVATEASNQNLTIHHAYQTVAALEAIAQHVAFIPGRKSLIWLSSGFPISIGYDGLPIRNRAMGTDDRNFMDLVERAARALNAANLAVYPVDAAALVAPVNAASRVAAAGVRPGAPPVAATATPREHAIDTMIAIADRTGGRAFYNTNDLSNAIRIAIEDGRVVYMLAYVPAHEQWNGKFRRIKVQTSRAGVHLHYRQGYFALPDEPLDSDGREKLVEQAKWNPVNATEIGLTAHARWSSEPAHRELQLILDADARSLRFEPNGDRHNADLLFVTCHKNIRGQCVGGTSNKVQLTLTEEQYQKVTANGVRLRVNSDVEAEVNAIRLILLDAATGSLGTVDVPLAEVPETAPPAAKQPEQTKP